MWRGEQGVGRSIEKMSIAEKSREGSLIVVTDMRVKGFEVFESRGVVQNNNGYELRKGYAGGVSRHCSVVKNYINWGFFVLAGP